MSIIHINKHNFHEEVITSDKPVLLDFQVAQEREDIKVVKVNVDEEPELAGQFRVYSIPTLAVMKDGQLIHQSAGARPKHQILGLI